MPLLKCQLSIELEEDTKQSLMQELSSLASRITGKPEQYIMVSVSEGSFLMGGQPVKGAFLAVRGIGGLGGDINRQLSEGICNILQEKAGISPGQVYINFADVAPNDWGWNNGTFG